MSDSGIDEKFVAQQKERLLEIREELVRVREGMAEDAEERSQEEQDNQFDSGDMSQEIFTREMDATIEGQVGRRLEDVDRALEKIDKGSYGVCDDTGEEIAKGRLEAMPEAIRTVEAQQRFERERRPTQP